MSDHQRKIPHYDSISSSNAQNQGHITVDAVHPFFKGYSKQLRDAQTSTEDDLAYHCKECEVYFPKNLKSVIDHFTKRTHMPVDSCVYCGGPVCEYYYNYDKLVYHTCENSDQPKTNFTFLTILKRKFNLGNGNFDVS